VEAAAAVLAGAAHIAVLTGAGISAESGLATFREAQTGLWARYRPEDLATPEAFARQPRLVWEWYAWRREQVLAAEPNAGHRALVEMERFAPGFTLVTQNVDGLHRRAGSRGVLELHGDIMRTRCSREGRLVERWAGDSVPPACPSCGAPLRPDVVWFGEALPAAPLEAAVAAAADCDVLLVVGTSLLVYPAASLVPVALAAGGAVIVVDPNLPALPPHPRLGVLALPAAVALPALVAAAWGSSSG
jgi:NAD-dependent deacetylase